MRRLTVLLLVMILPCFLGTGAVATKGRHAPLKRGPATAKPPPKAIPKDPATEHYLAGEKAYKAADYATAIVEWQVVRNLKPSEHIEQVIYLATDALGKQGLDQTPRRSSFFWYKIERPPNVSAAAKEPDTSPGGWLDRLPTYAELRERDARRPATRDVDVDVTFSPARQWSQWSTVSTFWQHSSISLSYPAYPQSGGFVNPLPLDAQLGMQRMGIEGNGWSGWSGSPW